ncbi:MFS transporter [Pontibacterium granulatum]|uniref:MFS transporter n=1 Tax=Pontibacterium granulatum TaxID=2036029 RepID=UPI00249AB3E0|nr:MFS transporter [Pontibacterium granulatum]MDI3326271.1 MFS transporter [Pontibacterium granulatum]
MTATFISLISLFISCFILFLGNGLMNVLMPVRMELDGISTDAIGLVQSLYFVGLLLGAIYSKNLIMRAGHIRMFAGCVSMGGASMLVCSLVDDAYVWGGMRLVVGFCNACAFAAMESWLSDASTKNTRGKVLAIYNAVVLAGLFVGQFFMNFSDPATSTLFVVSGVLLSLAVVPVVMSRHKGPKIEDATSMPLRTLFRISPLGVVSCLVSGVIYSASFNLLPLFAKDYGIVGFQLSLYVGAAIAGAFLLQFPVGYLSDRFDRRTVLLGLLAVSAVNCLLVIIAAPLGMIWAVFVATGITCGIIACTYPLSISEAFDKLRQNEMVAAMGSMILAFSLGGVIGPYSASWVMKVFGNSALFYFLAVIQVALAVFVIYRMRVREALPVEDQESFVMQGAAVPAIVDLDPRTEYVEREAPLSAEAQTIMGVAEYDPIEAVRVAKAIIKSNPLRATELAGAVAKVENLNVLSLYEAMNDVVPFQILEVTNAIVTSRPELASELVKKLAEWYPEQVVSVAAEIGRALPEQRVEMARIAAEHAPESAVEVARYYAQVLAEYRENLRPADREGDTSEADAVNIAATLWDASPDQALDVAATFVDAVPDSAVSVAQLYLHRDLLAAAAEVEISEEEKQGSSLDELEAAYSRRSELGSHKAEVAQSDQPIEAPDVSPEEIQQGAAELVQRLAEVAPDQAVDVAVAVVEAEPEAAAAVASEVANTWSDSTENESADGAPEETSDVSEALTEESIGDESSEELQDAAVELVQRLSEVAPDQAVDVAVAVVEAEPEVAAVVASEVASTWSELDEEADSDKPQAQTQEQVVSGAESDSSVEESEDTYEAAVELVQRLSEVAPDQAVDVAVAVVEAEPDAAASVAAEVASTMSDAAELDETENDEAGVPEDAQDESEQVIKGEEEGSHEAAVELVQRLSEVSPDNAMDVAVAVVESIPEAASDVVDAISEGEEAKEEEWMMGLDEKPEDFDEQADRKRKPD